VFFCIKPFFYVTLLTLLFSLFVYVVQILSGVRPPFGAQDHPAEVRALIEAAWHSDPAARPSMAALLANLAALC